MKGRSRAGKGGRGSMDRSAANLHARERQVFRSFLAVNPFRSRLAKEAAVTCHKHALGVYQHRVDFSATCGASFAYVATRIRDLFHADR